MESWRSDTGKEAGKVKTSYIYSRGCRAIVITIDYLFSVGNKHYCRLPSSKLHSEYRLAQQWQSTCLTCVEHQIQFPAPPHKARTMVGYSSKTRLMGRWVGKSLKAIIKEKGPPVRRKSLKRTISNKAQRKRTAKPHADLGPRQWTEHLSEPNLT